MGPAAAMTELGLDLRPHVCMSRFLDAAMWGNVDVGAGGDSSRVAKMEEYLRCLEEERGKIDAFKRELPLCMVILTDVIDALKEDLKQCKRDGAVAAGGRPVLEQFMPISTNKSTMMAVAEEEEEGSGGDGSVAVKSDKDAEANEKMNWMMSAQLWSDNSSDCNTDTYSNSNTNNITSCYKASSNKDAMDNNCAVGSMRNQDERGCGEADRQSESGNPFASSGGYKYKTAGGGAFLPFNKALSSSQQASGGGAAGGGRKGEEKAVVVPAPPPLPVDLSLVTPGLNPKSGSSRTAARLPEEYRSSCGSASSKVRTFVPPESNNGHLNSAVQPQHQQQGSRKARRCWSPELHRRFVGALQQLGGSHVATPKQIRELMKVDGLTNDEVKSHLQKYRLHTRRLAPPSSASGSAANQPPVVMLGGLWVSSASVPEECVTVTGSKQSNSVSGSPQGPLQLVGGIRGGGLSFTGVDSCGEEEEDGRSESYSWKGSNNQRLVEEETD